MKCNVRETVRGPWPGDPLVYVTDLGSAKRWY